MTQQRIITTSDVSINTATIEVKVMKIGNRQVTLAVFRQLPSRPVIDVYTGEIQGIPWGRVNYHIGCEGMAYPHLHIVWQLENQLFRACPNLPWRGGYVRQEYIDLPPEEYERVIQAYERSYARLAALDQLFIAV